MRVCALAWLFPLFMGSCFALEESVERQKNVLHVLNENQKILLGKQTAMESRFKAMERGLDLSLSRLYCLDKNVEAFLSVCNNKNSTYCSKKSFDDVLIHMASQRHEVVYPNPVGNKVHALRIEALKLLLTDHIEYSTKFIILARTPNDTPESIQAHEERAGFVISAMRRILREQTGQGESAIRLIGPWVYPFRIEGRDIDAIYKRHPNDKPLGVEQKASARREDGIWIFRTDCPVGD